MMKRIRREEGFTLIELMVVVLIIGILVAIAVPVYFSAQQGAKNKTCNANLRTMDSAIQTYIAGDADQSNPASLNDLVPSYLAAVPACRNNGAYSLITDGSDGEAAAHSSCSVNGTTADFINS